MLVDELILKVWLMSAEPDNASNVQITSAGLKNGTPIDAWNNVIEMGPNSEQLELSRVAMMKLK